MVDNKTPEEDFKRFEAFLDAMQDIEYNYWLAHEATTKQRNLAMGLREELDEDEQDDLIEKHRDALRAFYAKW